LCRGRVPEVGGNYCLRSDPDLPKLVLRRHELRSFFLISGVAEPNTDKLPNKNPLFMIEEEQREHIAKLNKMEREMEEVGSMHFNTIYFLRTRQSPTVDP
jgi:hypothetical protein